MFLYIPYGSDAPIYRRPIITVVMIVVNIVVFAMFTYEQFDPYTLFIGQGLHPVQWLTCNFLHGNIVHLIFNMFFLWVFGSVIEGRIGAFKMLALYLGMAILLGAIVQALTLGGAPNVALGSSGVLFGLAAMSFIWAPESKVHGILIYILLLVVRVKDVETDMKLVVSFFAIVQFLASLLFGNGLIGELGHVVGIVLGLAAAITMLKRKLVDCEYEDIFSVYSGAKDRAEMEERKTPAERLKEKAEERQKRQNLLSEEIEWAIQNQTPLPAFIIAQRKEREFAGWTLPEELHFKMIQQLLGSKHWTEATASMRQYLARHQEQAFFVSLMLAQALLAQDKPQAAAKVLDGMPSHEIGVEQQSAILKIRTKAETMHRKNLDEGIYELEE